MSTRGESHTGVDCCGAVDAEWGRTAGARPPLRWWVPLATWGVLAVALSVIVVFVVRGPGPEDDPDPAEQRDGLLLDGPLIPEVVSGVRFGDHTVVVLFERDPPSGTAYDDWRATVTDDGVELVVVVRGTEGATDLARVLKLPKPVDGGFPVGYAVVDAEQRLSYSTLDPEYAANAFEVDVITGAVR